MMKRIRFCIPAAVALFILIAALSSCSGIRENSSDLDTECPDKDKKTDAARFSSSAAASFSFLCAVFNYLQECSFLISPALNAIDTSMQAITYTIVIISLCQFLYVIVPAASLSRAELLITAVKIT
jgi:hypothetical protein